MRAKFLQDIIDETPKDVEIFVRWYADLTIRINRLLREKGLSQKDLAEALGKQPSEISKWMNGGHNFTLRSLAKLQAELGEELLTISTVNPFSRTFHKEAHFTVWRNRSYQPNQTFENKYTIKQDKIKLSRVS